GPAGNSLALSAGVMALGPNSPGLLLVRVSRRALARARCLYSKRRRPARSGGRRGCLADGRALGRRKAFKPIGSGADTDTGRPRTAPRLGGPAMHAALEREALLTVSARREPCRHERARVKRHLARVRLQIGEPEDRRPLPPRVPRPAA